MADGDGGGSVVVGGGGAGGGAGVGGVSGSGTVVSTANESSAASSSMSTPQSVVDVHAHLADKAFDKDIDDVLARAQAAGVATIVAVSENVQDAKQLIVLAKRWPKLVRLCLGLHPAQPEGCVKLADLEPMEALIRENVDSLVGIGEVGLDYTPRVLGDDPAAAKETQREVLTRQAKLALELDLPLNVHSRSAGHHAIELLHELGVTRAVFHAFDGKAKYARAGAAHGYKFSVPPSIARSPQMQKMVKQLELDNLVLETDSPALPAVARERNEPCEIVTSLAEVARVKGLSKAEVAAATTKNAVALFKL